MAQPITPINSVSLFTHLLINVIAFVVKVVKKVSPGRGILIVVISLFISVLILGTSMYLRPTGKIPLSLPTKIPTPPSQVGVWIAYWDEATSVKSLALANNEIKTISPVWYRLDPDGALINTLFSQKEKILNIASELPILIMPTINNEYEGGFDPERVSKIINDEDKSNKLIMELVEIAKKEGYHGWDVDWEKIEPSDKESYTKFVKGLAEALHDEGYRLSVTVHAQTDGLNNWEGTEGQDLKGLAKYADEIRVMAYDFHYSDSPPGPITPLDNLESVLEFSANNIPTNKLVLGLPLYGYDWGGNKGESIQYLKAINTIEANFSVYKRDEVSKELTAKYTNAGVEHELWFQDSESVGEKIALARRYGVYKFFFWRLGNEDPLIWETYKNY